MSSLTDERRAARRPGRPGLIGAGAALAALVTLLLVLVPTGPEPAGAAPPPLPVDLAERDCVHLRGPC